jgi:autocrine motility factor receptor
MPVILLERLPLPSLRTYTALSICLLACSLYYAHSTLLEDDSVTIAVFELLEYNINLTAVNGSVLEKAYLMAYVLSREPWCIVTLINMAYCCLILFGKLIQQIVFGRLRVVEEQHVKDKFWNFVFYKFIFIFGVMNAQEMEEIVLWCTWFSVLGFLHILAQLCKDRFEYLSFSPATPLWTHGKVLMLLVGVHLKCLALLVVCVAVGYYYTGINTFAFMAAETLLLVIKTLYVLVRYSIHLWDVVHDGVWENRAIYVYYCELIFEVSALFIDFCHHLHMLLWGNIFLSMASLVICMQLRFLFHEFQRRIRRHQNYRRVVSCMEARFPMAAAEDLQRNSDDCAICWEKMESARKLPCGHVFHNGCLRSWLEQDTSCPTCRMSLSDLNARPAEATPVVNNQQVPEAQRRARRTNRFHFDASRYVSWLPSFSVEVTHMLSGYAVIRPQQTQTSQFDNMARQVSEVFPSVPLSVIVEDLRVTNSVELTIDNIVEGRLPVAVDFTSSDVSVISHPNDDELLPTALDPENRLPMTALFRDETTALSSVGRHTSSFGTDVGSAMENLSSSDNSALVERDDSLLAAVSAEHNDGDNMPRGTGCRFSKSSLEREVMLAQRKETLLDHARRRYMVRDVRFQSPDIATVSQPLHLPATVSPTSSSHVESSVDLARQRRELVYSAIQRRLQSP